MAGIAPASGIGTTSNELKTSRKTIGENFDTFLSILTTQLKNQNPLDPLDTNQFTQQMVQFTGVEQQLKTNEYLEALIKANEGSFSSQAVSYIGKAITAFGDTTEMKDNKAEWTYGLTTDAAESTITIKNAAGAVVHTEDKALAKGEHTYKWDGKGSDGASLPEGQYSLHIEAKSAEGAKVNTYTMTKGIVDTVDFAGNEPILIIDGAKIPLSSVGKVSLAS
ncbi:flagellar hook assembly protein FlgD [Maritalea sp.]|uniref:flagellar hook assembly protein FlgD n=1 Tax=Maritalea sp. TaxID=2003361 RepID=UPI003EF84800